VPKYVFRPHLMSVKGTNRYQQPRKSGSPACPNSVSTAPDRTFHVQRVKGSEASTHTLDRDESAGLRKLQEAAFGQLVSISERGEPIITVRSSARRLM
jgi:hypothetical protein